MIGLKTSLGEISLLLEVVMAGSLWWECQKVTFRGGGQVVNVLSFYSNDPSSNPTKVCSYILKNG